MCVPQTGERGTIKPKANFDAKDDAVALRKAIEGLGTNTHTILLLLKPNKSLKSLLDQLENALLQS